MHYMGLECGVYVLQKLWSHEILISMYDSVCSIHHLCVWAETTFT